MLGTTIIFDPCHQFHRFLCLLYLEMSAFHTHTEVIPGSHLVPTIWVSYIFSSANSSAKPSEFNARRIT